MKLRKDIGKEKSFDAEYGCEHTKIPELQEWLSDMVHKGATHIDWDCICDYDGQSSEVNAQAFMEYEESEEQKKDREAKDETNRKLHEEMNTQQELIEYERLKQKFGTK